MGLGGGGGRCDRALLATSSRLYLVCIFGIPKEGVSPSNSIVKGSWAWRIAGCHSCDCLNRMIQLLRGKSIGEIQKEFDKDLHLPPAPVDAKTSHMCGPWRRMEYQRSHQRSHDNVTVYGLFVEYCEGFQTLWNAEGWSVFVYQCERPYDFLIKRERLITCRINFQQRDFAPRVGNWRVLFSHRCRPALQRN